MIVNLSDQNSLVNKYLNQLRDQDVQQDSMRFRINLERMGKIFAYEISKTFEYSKCMVETPLGVAKSMKYDDQVILATILRAGLPLHNGLLSFFDDAASAFISAYRKHHKGGSFDIKSGLCYLSGHRRNHLDPFRSHDCNRRFYECRVECLVGLRGAKSHSCRNGYSFYRRVELSSTQAP